MITSHWTIISTRTTVISIFIASIIRITCTRSITASSCITRILTISLRSACIFTITRGASLTRLTFCTLLFALLTYWSLTTCIRSWMSRTSLATFATLIRFTCMATFTSTTAFCITMLSSRSTRISATTNCFLLTLSRRRRLYCSHLCSMLIICCIHSSS